MSNPNLKLLQSQKAGATIQSMQLNPQLLSPLSHNKDIRTSLLLPYLSLQVHCFSGNACTLHEECLMVILELQVSAESEPAIAALGDVLQALLCAIDCVLDFSDFCIESTMLPIESANLMSVSFVLSSSSLL